MGNYYQIAVADKDESPAPEEFAHLCSLAPRIGTVARRELGSYFLHLEEAGRGHTRKNVLLLGVRYGASSDPEVKFKLRSLIGWIELFDDEIQQAA